MTKNKIEYDKNKILKPLKCQVCGKVIAYKYTFKENILKDLLNEAKIKNEIFEEDIVVCCQPKRLTCVKKFQDMLLPKIEIANEESGVCKK